MYVFSDYYWLLLLLIIIISSSIYIIIVIIIIVIIVIIIVIIIIIYIYIWSPERASQPWQKFPGLIPELQSHHLQNQWPPAQRRHRWSQPLAPAAGEVFPASGDGAWTQF